MNVRWDCETVAALNELQTGARFGHPYTCPNRGDGKHRHNGRDTGCLVATEHGWVCPDCDYTQDWAHASSAALPRVSEMVGVLGGAAGANCAGSTPGGAGGTDGDHAATMNHDPGKPALDLRRATRGTLGLLFEHAEGAWPADGPCGKSHIMDMLHAIEGGTIAGEKAHRWLGWAQCAVVASGCGTLDDMKAINAAALVTG